MTFFNIESIRDYEENTNGTHETPSSPIATCDTTTTNGCVQQIENCVSIFTASTENL